MQPQYQQLPQPNPYAQYQQPRAPRGKGWLWTLLVFILLTATAAGVYFWQQGQVDAARREKDQAVQQAQQAAGSQSEAAQPVEFTAEKLPFSFKRPADWTLQTDGAVTYETEPESYVLSLYAPGTVEVGTPIGGTSITSGASIVVSVSKKPGVTSLEDLLGKLPGGPDAKPAATNVTVAGAAAIEYEYAYESPKRLFTQVMKNSTLYTIYFETKSGEDLKTGDNYKAYQEVVKSFTFK